MMKITTPANMLKRPRPTIAPTTVPVAYFFFDGGLLPTVGIKSEHVTLRHQEDYRKEKEKNSPYVLIPGFALMVDISGPQVPLTGIVNVPLPAQKR